MIKMSVNKVADMEQYWSDDIENVLESIRHNASVMSDHHKKNYAYYKEQLKYYKIPVIIISGINSVVSVGLQPYMDQGMISAATCLLSLVCGIIGSIELFLRISDGMEIELAASKDFYLLSINIYKTLTLERKRRHEGGKEYLEHVYNTYTKLIEDAQVINTKIKDKLADVPVAGGKDFRRPSPSSPVYEKPRETRTGLGIRNTLFGPKKIAVPSEDAIVDKLFKRMAESANSPSITPPPVSQDLIMKNMMSQFQNQTDEMTRQMREMQTLLPKTSKGLVDKTLTDLKEQGSDIASLAIDVGDAVENVITDMKQDVTNNMLKTIEEGRSAFVDIGTEFAQEQSREMKKTVRTNMIGAQNQAAEIVNDLKDVKVAGKELVKDLKDVKVAGKELVKDLKDVKVAGNDVKVGDGKNKK